MSRRAADSYAALAADAPSSGTALTRAELLVSDGAAVDEGFVEGGTAAAPPFERGRVVLKAGAPHLDLSTLQQPLSTSGFVRSIATITGAALALPIGCCYLTSKLTLVQPGEVALVRSISGHTRALGAGWHLVDTVGCDILKARQTDTVIQFGSLTIVRVLPGELGKGQLNGQPLLLGAGVHLINDALFSFLGVGSSVTPHSASRTLARVHV